ncbi:hypothetical protein [Acidiphilium sp.]|uniref:hypothetical protein n=1 Tax=Acidiphilium sp. TaxID=527 RepID=UPI003D0608E3
MTYLTDLYAVLKGDGIALDETEAALLGIPNGETISLYEAMQARHGSTLAHIACALLWLVQEHHCRDQLANVPMQPNNYIRAFILLCVPIAAVARLIWWLV